MLGFFGLGLLILLPQGFLHAWTEKILVQGKVPVTLSEVMFDPAGSEATDEFIEIYNLSATDSVDLAGWRVGDGSGSDMLIDSGDGLVLAPGQFGLILDPDYFGNSTTYEGRIPTNALILTVSGSTLGSAGLSNSTPETIVLFDANGDTVDHYTYSLGNPPGYSDEKIDLAQNNSANNWSDSRQYLGTPGAQNSVSPLDVDLELVRLFSIPSKPQVDDEVELHLVVCNRGQQVISQFHVMLFEDSNHDNEFSENELLNDLPVQQSLTSQDSVELTMTLGLLSSGRHDYLAEAQVPEDKNLANNCGTLTILVSAPAGCVVINEIMYDPLPGQTEWIELYNPSSETVDLQGWRFSDQDTSKAVTICSVSSQLLPEGFCVLARDSSIFFQYSNISGSTVMLTGSFPSLNNDRDVVHLIDLTGKRIDQVPYSSSWGGGDGVSLEKINPFISGTDSTNWSSCVLAEGATPGEQNSIFVERLPDDAILSVVPNPFSPDGDGHDDFVIIDYKLPATTAYVNLKIFDVRGRLVRELFNCEPSGSSRQVVWNGCDDDNQKLRMGIYIIYLEALDGQHGILKAVKKALVLAGEL